jgi:FTR1 family protein
VEAALVVGICLAYLTKIDRLELKRIVWYAVGAASVASLVFAAALTRFAWNEETFEGILLLAAAALLVTMIIWMRRVARSLRGEIEQRIGHFAEKSRFAVPGLFLFVFVMVVREGAETVLLLQAVQLDTAGFFLWTGTLVGFAVAIGLAWFFFQGTLPIRLDRFFDATSIMLVVLAVQLTLTGIHELSEAQVIPGGPTMMGIVGPIVRNDIFFLAVLLGTAAWVVVREMLRSRHAAASAEGMNEAEQRLLRWRQQRERSMMTATVATVFVVLVALATDHVYARAAAQLSPAATIEAVGDEVRLPIVQVNDGELHRFYFEQGINSVRFIVIKRPDGTLAAALDACELCGPMGYYQDGANVICKHCGAVIYTPSIGLPGGCNPIPLESRLEGGELVIATSELFSGGSAFERH